MFFASDNTGPALPSVMAAITKANEGYAMPYGNDPEMTEVVRQIRELFEAPDASVHLVATGTAANALALATLTPAWGSVLCGPMAHIHVDECNAPEFFGGGIKTWPAGPDDKVTPEGITKAVDFGKVRDVRGPHMTTVSITQLTEFGTRYSLDEIKAVCDTAHEAGLPVHLDGARFANALVALGCSPAEMTWKAGIDAVSFGATKNGCLGVEAVVLFDPSRDMEFQLRRKRAAHLFSKHRYLSAQMLGYLQDDAWLGAARAANAKAAALAQAMSDWPGVRLLYPVDGNMIFAAIPRGVVRRLNDGGAVFYVEDGDVDGEDMDELLTCRLVCDWSLPDDEVERFLALAAAG